jgi:PAS domain S-box-containing protein
VPNSLSQKKTNPVDQNKNLIPSFQQLVETALEGVWVIDNFENTTYVNPSLCGLLGYSEEEMLELSVTNFMFSEDLEDHAQKIRDRKTGKTDSYERRFKKKDGSPIWMFLSAKPLQDENGNYAGSFVHLIDITDKKRRDRLISLVTEVQIELAKISEVDRVYGLIGRKIKEMIPEGIVGTTKVDDIHQTINITNLFGAGQTYETLVKTFKIDPTQIGYPLNAASPHELSFFQSGKFQLYDGGLYTLLLKRIPKSVCKVVEKQLKINQIRIIGFISEGRHFGSVVVMSEGDLALYITAIESIVNLATQVIKRLHSEKIKELSEARLLSTFDAIEDGYWDWDISTGKVITNEKWYTMLGYQPSEFPVTYDNFIKLLHPDDISDTTRIIEDALKNNQNQYNTEFRLRMKTGDYKFVQSRGKIVSSTENGKPLHMVGIHTDISQRKQHEEDTLLFYETQRKLVQVTNLSELYHLIGNCLSKLLPNGYIVFTRFDDQQKVVKIVGFYGFGKTLDELYKKYGLSESSFNVRVEDIEKEQMDLWLSSKLEKYNFGLYGIVTRKIPKVICRAIEKQLSINEIFVMGCKWKETDFGGFVLLTKNGLGNNKELIETLINETAIAIQRILTENESSETQARYQNIFKASPVGIVTVGLDFKFISANAEFCRFSGYSEDELKKMQFSAITHQENLETDIENIKKLLAGEISVYKTNKKYIRKNGEVVSGRVLVNRINDSQGKCLYLLAMVNDITREIAAEEAIKENQRFLEIVINSIPNYVFVRDIEGRYQLSNKAFAEAMGTTSKDIVGLTDKDFGDRSRLAEEVRLQDIEIIQTGKDWSNPDMEILFPKVGLLPVQFVKRALPVIENKSPSVLAVITDITERKQIEQDIRKSEAKYRLLTESMKDVIWTLDTETMKITYMSPSIKNLRGYSVEEAMEQGMGDKLLNVGPEDIKKIMQQQISEFLKDPYGPEKYFTQEFKQQTKDGKTIWTEIIVNYFFNQETGHIEMKGVSRDISERKQSELERQSLFEIMQGLSQSKDLDQFLKLIHQVIAKIIDAKNISIVVYNKDTDLFEEKYCIDEFDQPYPPSKLEKTITSYVFRTCRAVILGNKAFKALSRLGEVRLVGSPSAVWMGAPIKDGDDVIGVISVQNYQDENAYSDRDKEFLSSVAAHVAIAIKQKRAEEAIQQSEEKHRLLIENSHDIIYTLNLDGLFTFVSNAWSEFLGYPVDEIFGQPMNKFIYSRDRSRFEEFITSLIQTGERQTGFEYQIKHADGSWRWHMTNALPIMNTDGICIGIEGTARDITEQKLAETALQESEERYRVLVESSPVGIILIQKRKLIYINSAGINLFGYQSIDEMINLKLLDLLHPDSQKEMYKRAFDLRKENLSSPLEMKIIKKNGEVCDTESISSKVKIFGDFATLVFIQDISSRKKAEEKIRKNTEDLSLIQKLNDLVNQGGTLQSCIELVNEETKNLYSGNGAAVYLLDDNKEILELQGFQLPTEIVSTIERYLKIKIPKSKISLKSAKLYQDILSGKKLQYFEGPKQVMALMSEFTDNPIYRKMIPSLYKKLGVNSVIAIPLVVQNESVGLLEFSSKTVFEADALQRFEYIAVQLGSVIRRKQAEEALKESEVKFRQIVEKSNDIFLLENFDTLDIDYISPKVTDLLGYAQNEFLYATRNKIVEVIHPEDLHIFEGFRPNLIKSLQTDEKKIVLEFRIRSKNGEYKWFIGNYSLLLDDKDEPKSIMSTLSDITERKLNELILRFRVRISQLVPKLSMQELLVAILDEVEKITDSQFGFYHFVDQHETHIDLMSWSTNTSAIAENILAPENASKIEQTGVWLECLKQRRPLIHNEEDSVTPYDKKIEERLHIFRELAVPVMRKDKIVSVLGLGNKSTNYTLGDLEIVSKLADLVWDMVENKKIENELKETQAIFNAFMENSPIYVFFKDKDIRSKQLSRNFEQMLGKPLEQLLNKDMNELFPSDLSLSMIKDDQRVLREGKTVVVDEELDGKFYTTIKFPILIDDKPEYLAGFTIDITDRVLSERKLAESEELYRLISSVVSDYLFSTRFTDDGQLDLNWVAGAFEKITGYSMAEYKQMGGWRAALFPADVEIDDQDMLTLHQNKQVITELRTIRKNGEVIWVRVYSQPIWDEENNRLLGINGAVQDITERKKVEEEIKKSVDEFKALYETATDFSLHRDPFVILKTISDRASSLFGASNAFVYLYDPQQNDLELKFTRNPSQPLGLRIKMGEGISGLVAEKSTPMVINDYSKWEGRHPESTFNSIAAVMCVPMLYGGQLLGVLGVHENHPSELVFTEDDAHFLTLFASQAAGALYSADLFEKIRQNANELEKRVDERTKELKLKNKELETFTYTVSHDLKAPLRGISGYATLLMEDYSHQLDSEAKRYLDNLVTSAERMSLLIEDLLAYSRVERREIKKTNVNINELIDKITQEYKHTENTKKLHFKKEIEYGTVFTDQEALAQALRNLIDNAVKFSREQPEAEICIRTNKLEDHCLISIEDNGIGFDMKYYDKIFEIFQRLHLSEDYPGTGIGLAVVRKAVERLGGKIWAVSQPGEGSTFFMELPL